MNLTFSLKPLVWWSDGQVVTRNADGGTTAWEHADAVALHRDLGMIIAASGIGFQVAEEKSAWSRAAQATV